jgi:hypothetical protein
MRNEFTAVIAPAPEGGYSLSISTPIPRLRPKV